MTLIILNILLLIACIFFIVRYYIVSKLVRRLCDSILGYSEQMKTQMQVFQASDEALLDLIKEVFEQLNRVSDKAQHNISSEEIIKNELSFLAPEGEEFKVRRQDEDGDEFLLGDIVPKS